MNSIAKVNAVALAAVAIGNDAAVMERAGVHGVYNAVCEGYRDIYKDEYLKEHPRLLKMRAEQAMLLRFGRPEDTERLRKLTLELDQFERYMRSLTEVKWADEAKNLVTTVGKNILLDTLLAGSSYTVTGPYMGLIGAVSYGAGPVAADTMASHGGWTEAGTTNAPTYTGPRKTIAWNAASAGSKSPSSAPVYAMTGAGTVKGVFLVLGSGASSSIDNTSGTLYSAGLFSGGDQGVVATNTLTVTYAAQA